MFSLQAVLWVTVFLEPHLRWGQSSGMSQSLYGAVAYGGHPELPVKGRSWGRTKAIKPGPRVSSHPEALREKCWISGHPPLIRAIC